MGMFDNYDNLPLNYIPDNISQYPVNRYEILDTSTPTKLYSIKNNFIGYSWNYGDIFMFPVNVNKVIKVNADSIIYTEKGLEPDNETIGYAGQQAYNTVDNKSWTCIGNPSGLYVWVLDDEIIYPLNGTKEIEFQEDVTDKELIVEFYDFRWNLVKSFENFASPVVLCSIDENIYETMKSGIYYVLVKIKGIDTSKVKDKFMVMIR